MGNGESVGIVNMIPLTDVGPVTVKKETEHHD